METIFPSATGFSGKYTVGPRRHPSDEDVAQQLGVFVLKRKYEIAMDRLLPQDDPDGVLESDEIQERLHDGEPYFQVTHESNLAIYKPKADLIVLGSYQDGDNCEARITNAVGVSETWLRRTGSPTDLLTDIPDSDALSNMFGWEQRQFGPRRFDALDADNEPPVMAPVFDNLYFNGYRRKFAVGGFPKNQFPTGARVTIDRDPLPAGSNPVDFFLGEEAISAKLFLYDGKHPDNQRYWCCEPLVEIHLDTLVISPEDDSAYVVWRGIWDYSLYPPDRYRKLEVRAGEIH